MNLAGNAVIIHDYIIIYINMLTLLGCFIVQNEGNIARQA